MPGKKQNAHYSDKQNHAELAPRKVQQPSYECSSKTALRCKLRYTQTSTGILTPIYLMFSREESRFQILMQDLFQFLLNSHFNFMKQLRKSSTPAQSHNRKSNIQFKTLNFSVNSSHQTQQLSMVVLVQAHKGCCWRFQGPRRCQTARGCPLRVSAFCRFVDTQLSSAGQPY